MRVHSTISAQERSAKDIRGLSIMMLFLFAGIIIFSFIMDQVFTNQRNEGRDIRTHQSILISAVTQGELQATLIHFASDGKKIASTDQRNALKKTINQMQTQYFFLQRNSINSASLAIFRSGEETYVSLINLFQLYTEPSLIATEDQTKLIVCYTNQYLTILNRFFNSYTIILASNNTYVSVASFIELIIESAILIGFFVFVMRPSVKKFLAISEIAKKAQEEVLETKTFVNEIQKAHAEIYKLPFDVLCVDYNRYRVAHHGKTVIVNYSERYNMFLCECKIFAQSRSCFHTNRAKWLHDRIFQLKRHNSVH